CRSYDAASPIQYSTSRGCNSTARRKWRSARLKLPARKYFLPRLTSSLGSDDGGAAAADVASRGFGGRLPVIAGSSWDAPGVAAVFDWNMSPSLVELSQPLSHNRHATVATTTRRARALMDMVPRRPAGSVALRGESTRRGGRHTNRPGEARG